VARWQRWPWRRVALGALAASLLTHPVAWELSAYLPPDDYRRGWLMLEGVVCLVEALVLGVVLRVGAVPALALSLALNAASAAVGWWCWPWLRGL
jgi:hypothetical protein